MTQVLWNGKARQYTRAPRPEEITESPNAAYVHICSNETIGGIRFTDFPQTQAPLIADMSSEIMSRPIDVTQFGMIYAGAQKNIGPSGLALVIIAQGPDGAHAGDHADLPALRDARGGAQPVQHAEHLGDLLS